MSGAVKADAPKRRGRPPKAKKPPGPVQRVNPRWARSATPAAEPGKLGTRRASNATVLAGRKMCGPPAGRPKKQKKRVRIRKPWGRHTWEKRWHLEKKRSRKIAMLVPGMMLFREYHGTIHRVLVREKDYLHVTTNKLYPTLYSVTTAITGKTQCRNGRFLAPMSAARFWNLETLLVSRPT